MIRHMDNVTKQRFDKLWALDPVTGCHTWKSPAASRYYVRFHYQGRRALGHRLIWESVYGPIPEGLVVDHLCRNRACVNVGHMEVVTQAVNKSRGTSPPAVNSRKENCPRCGSDYQTENNGSRRCPKCKQRGRKDIKRKGVGRAKDRKKCPRGHPYDEENTYLVRRPDGTVKQRMCKECGRLRMSKSRNKLRKEGDAL